MLNLKTSGISEQNIIHQTETHVTNQKHKPTIKSTVFADLGSFGPMVLSILQASRLASEVTGKSGRAGKEWTDMLTS